MTRSAALGASHAPAHWRLGFWRLDRGDLVGARAAFARAREIDPDDPAAASGLARVLLPERDPRRAADLLEAWLSGHQGDRHALFLLGTAYRELGRDEDAAFALAVGLGGDPEWQDPWEEEVARERRGFAAALKEAGRRFLAGDVAGSIHLRAAAACPSGRRPPAEPSGGGVSGRRSGRGRAGRAR